MKTLFKRELFWDVNLENLNLTEHKEFIIRRILERGDLDDFLWALNNYKKSYLKAVFLKNFNKFDNKSKNFWLIYFGINKKNVPRNRK